VLHDQLGGSVHEPFVSLRAADFAEPEAYAQVDAALTVVAVRDGPETLLPEQCSQLAEVAAQSLWRYRGVLEAWPRPGAVGEPRRVASAILSDLPQCGLGGGLFDEADVGAFECATNRRGHPLCVCPRSGGVICACFYQQPGATGGKADILGPGMGQRKEFSRERLDRERLGGEQIGHARGALDVIAKSEDQQAARNGRTHQSQGGSREDRARTLRARQQLGHVGALLRQ